MGLSRQVVDGVGYGTPTHMPPEQFDTAADCDQRSDVYSLGVGLYQMAAGAVPVTGRRRPSGATRARPSACGAPSRSGARCAASMRRRPCRRPARALDPILTRCLAKAPSDRYRGFAELRGDIERLLAEISPPAAGAGRATVRGRRGAQARRARPDQSWPVGGATEASRRRCASTRARDDLDPVRGRPASAGAGRRVARGAGSRGRARPVPRGQLAGAGTDTARAWVRLDEAAASLDEAVAREPDSAAAWHDRGIVCQDAGRPTEAVVCYDRALELDAGMQPAWFRPGGACASSAVRRTRRCASGRRNGWRRTTWRR